MSLYVITSWSEFPTFSDTYIDLLTDIPTHLWMAVQSRRPIAHPLRKTTRGVPRICGWTYQWHPDACVDEASPGSHTRHSFIVHRPTQDPLWVLPTEGVACALPSPSGPPIELAAIPAPPVCAEDQYPEPDHAIITHTSAPVIPYHATPATTWEVLAHSASWLAGGCTYSARTIPRPGSGDYESIVIANHHWPYPAHTPAAPIVAATPDGLSGILAVIGDPGLGPPPRLVLQIVDQDYTQYAVSEPFLAADLPSPSIVRLKLQGTEATAELSLVTTTGPVNVPVLGTDVGWGAICDSLARADLWLTCSL